MSFNVRFGTADDGDNRWDMRKDLVVQIIEESRADLIGTQEMMRFQAEYINDKLKRYTYYGLTREPGNPDGEECGIFVDRERFAVLELRHFWLSESPEIPGSKSWDSSLPRMVTMIRLMDRQIGNELILANTHFDHKGVVARTESAKLIRNLLVKHRSGLPVIVCGDFNAGVDTEPFRELVKSEEGFALYDTFRAAHDQPTETEGTFNGFKGTNRGSRIDWILSSEDYKVETAAINDFNVNGRYPSDHFPVTAVLRLNRED